MFRSDVLYILVELYANATLDSHLSSTEMRKNSASIKHSAINKAAASHCIYFVSIWQLLLSKPRVFLLIHRPQCPMVGGPLCSVKGLIVCVRSRCCYLLGISSSTGMSFGMMILRQDGK